MYDKTSPHKFKGDYHAANVIAIQEKSNYIASA